MNKLSQWFLHRRRLLALGLTAWGGALTFTWIKKMTQQNQNTNKIVQDQSDHKKLYKILRPQEKHWVGDGFYVSTLFSVHAGDYRYITPFLLLDHAAPRRFEPTEEKLGVGVHPHRGFETVTFAIQGEVDHRDSGGGGGRITTGGVQWMTAGAGVVHEEFHSRKFAQTGGIFEMVQLWVNLKAKDKMINPRYQSMDNEDFPVNTSESGSLKVKVIAGEYKKAKGPAKTYSPINIFEVFANSEQALPLSFADQSNTLLVQLKGLGQIQGESLKAGEVALFEREGTQIDLKLSADSHLLVLNGEPIDEPIAHYGPFVMNTQEEIMQAIEDFQAGKMGQLVEEG
jgi:redox-sensitive bicupin YhaK (pirin superfamily)